MHDVYIYIYTYPGFRKKNVCDIPVVKMRAEECHSISKFVHYGTYHTSSISVFCASSGPVTTTRLEILLLVVCEQLTINANRACYFYASDCLTLCCYVQLKAFKEIFFSRKHDFSHTWIYVLNNKSYVLGKFNHLECNGYAEMQTFFCFSMMRTICNILTISVFRLVRFN